MESNWVQYLCKDVRERDDESITLRGTWSGVQKLVYPLLGMLALYSRAT